MKKFLFVLMTIIVATLISCTKKVDPIHGIQPLNEAYSNKMPKEIISNLKQRGDVNGLFSFFDKRRKQITTNIVSQYPKVNDHQQIKLILGTGYADAILAGDGKTYACTFSDELIILISDSAKTDTVFFFGGQIPKSELKFSKKIDFGSGEPFKFTISDPGKIDSLVTSLKSWAHVSNKTKPIKDKDGKVIEEKTFQNYLSDFKPFFKEGDIIDMVQCEIFDKSGQKVSIEQRKSSPIKKRRK